MQAFKQAFRLIYIAAFIVVYTCVAAMDSNGPGG